MPLVAVALVGLATGCVGPFRNPFASAGPAAPHVLRPGASLEEVITAVNANTARVQTYSANGATITVQDTLGRPALSGSIRIERPSRFRVYAGMALFGQQIDMGSNEELLWMWIAQSQPPAVYVCRRDQFAGSQAQAIMPVDPDWFPAALGLVEFEPHAEHHPLRLLPNRTLEVTSTLPGPGGPLMRVCVIDPTRAWVLQQHVYNPQGTLLASAVASRHRYFPEHQVSLPQRVEVHMPASQLRLAIDVGQVYLNIPLGDPGQLWMPPEGYPQVDVSGGVGGSAAAVPTQQAAGSHRHSQPVYRVPAPHPAP